MTDISARAALVDEQDVTRMDAFANELRGMLRLSVAPTSPADADAAFDSWYAAVIACAKREERERIGDELAVWLDSEYAPPIWYEAVDIADPTWCDRHPEEADDDPR